MMVPDHGKKGSLTSMSKEATLIALGTAVVNAVKAVDREYDICDALTELTLTPHSKHKGNFIIAITTTDDVDAPQIKDHISERANETS